LCFSKCLSTLYSLAVNSCPFIFQQLSEYWLSTLSLYFLAQFTFSSQCNFIEITWHIYCTRKLPAWYLLLIYIVAILRMSVCVQYCICFAVLRSSVWISKRLSALRDHVYLLSKCAVLVKRLRIQDKHLWFLFLIRDGLEKRIRSPISCCI